MAEYPGLGQPISEFGWSGNQMALGPYSFLPGAAQASAGGATMIGGMPSLNDQEFGHRGTSSTPTFSGSSTTTAGPSTAATGFLNGVLGGSNLPFTPNGIQNIQNQASDQAAQAEKANNQRATASAERGGASGSDPSLQGSYLNNQQERQTQNQQSAEAIQSQADQANFQAQMQAAQSENQLSIQQQQLGLEQQKLGMGFLPGLLGSGRSGLGGARTGGNVQTGSNSGFIGFGGDQGSQMNDDSSYLGTNGYYLPGYGWQENPTPTNVG